MFIAPADPTAATSSSAVSSDHSQLRQVAEKLEAGFLAEMLKAAGLGETRESFGGGIGEEQFTSFLRQAQADEMVKAGGIGLAQALFDAIAERADGTENS